MNYSKTYLSLTFIAIIIFAVPQKAFTQADTLSEASKDKPDKSGLSSQTHSLFCSAGFGSNMIYLGSTISQDKPFYSTGLTYAYKNHFFASLSASHLKGVSPYVAYYTLSFDYTHTFNSWFDISADLSGYKAAASLQERLFSDFAFINFTAGFDWKLIYTKLSIGGLISDNSRGYLQIRNSRYFQITEFSNGNGLISFDPNINTLFGQLVKIETSAGTTKFGYSPPFRHLKKKTTGTIESYSYKYGLMDFEFSLPLTFSYGNFSIEADPEYMLPAYTNPDYPAPKGFSFFLNASFKIL
jgi:hypothetical protein